MVSPIPWDRTAAAAAAAAGRLGKVCGGRLPAGELERRAGVCCWFVMPFDSLIFRLGCLSEVQDGYERPSVTYLFTIKTFTNDGRSSLWM